MKKAITKLFKLDEPLGRAGFVVASIIVGGLFYILDELTSLNFFELIIILSLITPFAVRRLKDLEMNISFALIFFFPFVIGSFVLIRNNFSDIEIIDGIARILIVFWSFSNIFSFLFFIYFVLKEGQIAEVAYKTSKLKKARDTIITISLIVVFFGYFIGGCQYKKYLNQKAALTIVAAVDQFELENGRFPFCLDELVPNYMDKIPKADRSFGGTDFWYDLYDDDGKEPRYCVGFIYMPVRHLSYCSNKREWIDWD